MKTSASKFENWQINNSLGLMTIDISYVPAGIMGLSHTVVSVRPKEP